MESSSAQGIRTTVDNATLMAACSGDADAADAALGAIIGRIDATIRGVDEDFTALRTSHIRSAPDPRLIGLSADPRDPNDFYFNTWRHFGAGTCWKFPGLAGDGDVGEDGSIAPDAVRRAQAGWNMGAGLILPVRKDSAKLEVLITLDVDAMEVLGQDPSWQTWVDEVVE